MKQRVVIIDVDGVLADFILGFTGLLQTISLNENGPPISLFRYDEVTVWDEHIQGVSRELVNKTWARAKGSEEFWTSLRPIPNDEELTRLAWLCDAHERYAVYFVTARPGRWAKSGTEKWLKAHGIAHPTVVMTEKKVLIADAVGADFAIDDKFDNVRALAQVMPWRGACILDRAYNQGEIPNAYRVPSLGAFLSYVMQGDKPC